MANRGRFINRETQPYWNGDYAITDTFMLEDGTLVYHTYNITADKRQHSHQVMDEYGRHLYAREICDRAWIEVDRINAKRWLSTLSLEALETVLGCAELDTLKMVREVAKEEDNSLTKKESSLVKVKTK